jgi:Adaptin C-terminal domain
LKLLTRAVDEDVAILPDEDLTFKVKPKVDPLGELCTTDYTTTLRVSANGVSVCVPDPNGGQGGGSTLSSITGGSSAQKEMYFWVYTDFYKWSLIKKDEKLALLVNVFADSSFSRRNEFIFRQKESERLATAIEFFIEKFMSVMHIRLETTAGAFDDVVEPVKKVVVGAAGMHTASNFESNVIENTYSPPEELDLLGLDIEDEPPLPPARTSMGYEGSFKGNQGVQSYQQPSFNDNPFGDDPFGEAPAVKAKVASHNVDPFDDDMFKVEAAPIPAYVPTPAYVPAPSHVAAPSFAADPFGDDPFAGSEQSSPAPVASYAQSFGDDPFGSPEPVPVPVAAVQPVSPKAATLLNAAPVSFEDPFGPASSLLSTGLSGPLIAPPLTPQQLEQHTLWLQGALTSGGGPLYDDGNLQIASKIEVRGSQGRITIYYRSMASEISEFNVSVKDSAGLVRCQLSPLSVSSLSAGGQTEQQLLVECMQPASPGPQLCITYLSAHGRRTVSVDLPLMVTTFNEPLALSGADFSARWDLLVSPGQEAQEVLSPPRPVVPREIHSVLTAVRYALYFLTCSNRDAKRASFISSCCIHVDVSIIARRTPPDPPLFILPPYHTTHLTLLYLFPRTPDPRSQALKFGHVTGLPDESEFVIYGAACT